MDLDGVDEGSLLLDQLTDQQLQDQLVGALPPLRNTMRRTAYSMGDLRELQPATPDSLMAGSMGMGSVLNPFHMGQQGVLMGGPLFGSNGVASIPAWNPRFAGGMAMPGGGLESLSIEQLQDELVRTRQNINTCGSSMPTLPELTGSLSGLGPPFDVEQHGSHAAAAPCSSSSGPQHQGKIHAQLVMESMMLPLGDVSLLGMLPDAGGQAGFLQDHRLLGSGANDVPGPELDLDAASADMSQLLFPSPPPVSNGHASLDGAGSAASPAGASGQAWPFGPDMPQLTPMQQQQHGQAGASGMQDPMRGQASSATQADGNRPPTSGGIAQWQPQLGAPASAAEAAAVPKAGSGDAANDKALLQQQQQQRSMRRCASAIELHTLRALRASGSGTFGRDSLVVGAKVVELVSPEGRTYHVGKLGQRERQEKILRYKQKRTERNFSKRIKYQCRKTLADSRPRVRGRFARNDELGAVLPHERAGGHAPAAAAATPAAALGFPIGAGAVPPT